MLEAGKFIPAGGGCGLYTSRKLFEEINGFNESLKFWEDVDYVQRATEKGYKLKLLKNVKIWVSTRRLDAEGRVNAVIQFFRGISHWLSEGTIPRENDIYYPMDLNYAKLLKENNVSYKDLNVFITKYVQLTKIIKSRNQELYKKYKSLFTFKGLMRQIRLAFVE